MSISAGADSSCRNHSLYSLLKVLVSIGVGVAMSLISSLSFASLRRRRQRQTCRHHGAPSLYQIAESQRQRKFDYFCQ